MGDIILKNVIEPPIEFIQKLESEGDEYERYERELLRPWDANETYVEGMRRAKLTIPNLVRDENFITAMKTCSLYYSNDNRFPGDLNKGLYWVGNTGVGKTAIMQCFAMNKRCSFLMRNAMAIADGYQQNGIDEIAKYFNKIPTSPFDKSKYFNQKTLGICIDDIGTEEVPARHYGQEINVFEKIISYRYQLKGSFHQTHFTSNLDASEIEARYGTRVRSRLKEMCNFIVMPGEDRRR